LVDETTDARHDIGHILLVIVGADGRLHIPLLINDARSRRMDGYTDFRFLRIGGDIEIEGYSSVKCAALKLLKCVDNLFHL